MKTLVVIVALALNGLSLAQKSLSTKAYIEVTGQQQGAYKGGDPHHKNMILLTSFSTTSEVVQRSRSGQPTFRSFQVKLGAADAAQFQQSFNSGEQLKKVQVDVFTEISPNLFKETQTINLTNPMVKKIEVSMEGGKEVQKVTFYCTAIVFSTIGK